MTTIVRADVMRPSRNYLRAGEPCRIKGERGVFRFVALAVNRTTGATWAEVVGPADNPRTRSFRPERVRRIARTTGGRA